MEDSSHLLSSLASCVASVPPTGLGRLSHLRPNGRCATQPGGLYRPSRATTARPSSLVPARQPASRAWGNRATGCPPAAACCSGVASARKPRSTQGFVYYLRRSSSPKGARPLGSLDVYMRPGRLGAVSSLRRLAVPGYVKAAAYWRREDDGHTRQFCKESQTTYMP